MEEIEIKPLYDKPPNYREEPAFIAIHVKPLTLSQVIDREVEEKEIDPNKAAKLLGLKKLKDIGEVDEHLASALVNLFGFSSGYWTNLTNKIL